jgi:hypothetical protein
MDIEHTKEIEHLVQLQCELAAEEPVQIQTTALLSQPPLNLAATQPRKVNQGTQCLPHTRYLHPAAGHRVHIIDTDIYFSY